jgi:hypothetical protein
MILKIIFNKAWMPIMNKPETSAIAPCPTVRLAASELVAVDRCSCGTLRIHLGALTLRITAAGLQTIMQTLGEALIANVGMRAGAHAVSRGKAPRGQS